MLCFVQQNNFEYLFILKHSRLKIQLFSISITAWIFLSFSVNSVFEFIRWWVKINCWLKIIIFKENSDDSWSRKLTLRLGFWHLLTNCHSLYSQNTIMSFLTHRQRNFTDELTLNIPIEQFNQKRIQKKNIIGET